MISVEDALNRTLAKLAPLESEDVATVEAFGRVLRAPVSAQLTQPPFDAAAMDGYGVRADDLTKLPATLDVIGEAAAGHSAGLRVGPGQAVRIFTGAPVPGGVDTVVMQEDTDIPGDGRITIRAAGPKGHHIRKAGVDFNKGDVCLQAGQCLTARDIGLLAAMNVPRVTVTRRPKVAILATGDELVKLGDPVGTDQIVSSIPPALCAYLTEWGATPLLLGIARDTEDSLRKTIAGAKDADMIITIGGASVGDKDLVKSVLGDVGLEIDFWRIAMKPGKPFIYGQLNGVPLLGLPGNPVSALVCAVLYVQPALDALLGRPRATIGHPLHQAFATQDLRANSKRQDYIRATLALDGDGKWLATPCSLQDSSVFSTLATADCLIVRPPHAEAAKAGSPVKVFLLGDTAR